MKIARYSITKNNSFHSLKSKISKAYGLIDTIVQLTRNATIYNTRNIAMEILLKKGYPRNFYVQNMLKKHRLSKVQMTTCKWIQLKQITTPNLHQLILSKEHRKELRQIYQNIYQTKLHSKQLILCLRYSQNKDQIPIDKHHDVVYGMDSMLLHVVVVKTGTLVTTHSYATWCQCYYALNIHMQKHLLKVLCLLSKYCCNVIAQSNNLRSIGNTAQLLKKRKNQHEGTVGNRDHRKSALVPHSIHSITRKKDNCKDIHLK